MTDTDRPVGELFSHVYVERGPPGLDGDLFRRRLGGFLDSSPRKHHRDIANFLKRETGLSVPIFQGYLNFEKFFESSELRFVLNSITLIWHYVMSSELSPFTPREWQYFVARVFREENLGYELDQKCGVHYLVDQEFERNRAAALSGLESGRYANVRDAFERAHHHMDTDPRDTKAAVRSMFECLEILTKLMTKTARLDVGVMKKDLKRTIQDHYADDQTASTSANQMLDGFAQWIVSLQQYRHGQGREDPVAPPVDYSVYVVSSGAAFLRWLLAIDHAHQDESG